MCQNLCAIACTKKKNKVEEYVQGEWNIHCTTFSPMCYVTNPRLKQKL